MTSGAQSRWLHDFYWSHAGPAARVGTARGDLWRSLSLSLSLCPFLPPSRSLPTTVWHLLRQSRCWQRPMVPHETHRPLNVIGRTKRNHIMDPGQRRLSHRHDNERLSVGPRILRPERKDRPGAIIDPRSSGTPCNKSPGSRLEIVTRFLARRNNRE